MNSRELVLLDAVIKAERENADPVELIGHALRYVRAARDAARGRATCGITVISDETAMVLVSQLEHATGELALAAGHARDLEHAREAVRT